MLPRRGRRWRARSGEQVRRRLSSNIRLALLATKQEGKQSVPERTITHTFVSGEFPASHLIRHYSVHPTRLTDTLS